MSANLVAICGFIYLYVALEQVVRGQWWVAILYFGYAFANVGAWKIAKVGVAH